MHPERTAKSSAAATDRHLHPEQHVSEVRAWLRAAVLGANDGIVSTASLVLGVAAASTSSMTILTAGLAGLVGGSLSMAAGEYVSVSSQLDLELADLTRERAELLAEPERELDELTSLLAKRGLPEDLARAAALAFTENDDLAAHAQEELGIDLSSLARPVQAASVSALAFALGAFIPLLAMILLPASIRIWATFATALGTLAILGAWGAKSGGAPQWPAVRRVLVGGGFAMGLTAFLGYLFGLSLE